MMKLDIDIRGLEAQTLRESKRLAYSTVQAINKTLQVIQLAERAELDRRFQIRNNRFMYSLIKITRFASVFKGIGPQLVYGEIAIDNSKGRVLLGDFVEGGYKEPVQGKTVGVPVTGGPARPSFSDPVTAAFQLSKIKMQPRVLKDGTVQHVTDQDGGLFTMPTVPHGTQVGGIFTKPPGTAKAIAVYLFIQHPQLKRRYDFLGIAEAVFNEEWDRQFDMAYNRGK